jgi:septal ring factor EnvC (AmiA/AmiB activator)
VNRRLLLPAALIAALAGGLALAQTAAPEGLTLAQAEREAEAAALRSKRLEAQAAEATGDAARARAEAEALIADIERIEAEITRAELRVTLAERLRAGQRARLAERQRPLIGLTSALETMARRPPALALVQPGSVGDIVRLRAMLASTLPAVRERTAGLRAELAAGDRLRDEAGRALGGLAASREALQRRRLELAGLEDNQLRRSEGLAEAALSETDRSVALGEEARELSARMRTRAYQAALRAELAGLPGPILRPPPGEAPSPRPGRAAPYRLPVDGRLITGMGEISDAGVHARGLTFETRANAPVVAPRAGRIVYAGRFRSYGEIVIIDHGHGWASTLTDLTALRVRQGDTVRAGDPLGRSSRHVTVELRRRGHPQPITPLLS